MASVNPSEKQMRIVLLGKTGVGKSATGNTILGERSFESRASGTSVTTFCRVGFNSAVRVIDTPGFFDTRMSNNAIGKEIVKCIAMSAPGPHTFIIVVKPDRFTQEEIDTVNLIKEKFGQEVMRYMLVLFVRRDDLDADGISIEDFLKTVPDPLKNVLRDCENKYIAFNNRAGDEEKMQQSRALIDLVHSLVERNGGKYYSHEIYIAAEKAMCAEENKRKQELEEKKNKEIEAIKRSILQDNHSKEKEYQDRITKLEKDVAKQKDVVREQVVRDVGNDKFNIVEVIGQFVETAVKKCSIM